MQRRSPTLKRVTARPSLDRASAQSSNGPSRGLHRRAGRLPPDQIRERPRRRRHLDQQLQSLWLDSGHVWHCEPNSAAGSEAYPSKTEEHLDLVTNSRNHAFVNRRTVLYKRDLAAAIIAASQQEPASTLSKPLNADPLPGGTRPRRRDLPRSIRAPPPWVASAGAVARTCWPAAHSL